MQWMRRQLFIRTYDINKPDKEEIRGLDMNEQKELIIARLREKGYNCRLEAVNEKREVNFVNDFLKKDMPTAGQLHRYSFDMRA